MSAAVIDLSERRDWQRMAAAVSDITEPPHEPHVLAEVLDLAAYRETRRLAQQADTIDAVQSWARSFGPIARRGLLALVSSLCADGRKLPVKTLVELYGEQKLEAMAIVESLLLEGTLEADYKPMTLGLRGKHVWLAQKSGVL